MAGLLELASNKFISKTPSAISLTDVKLVVKNGKETILNKQKEAWSWNQIHFSSDEKRLFRIWNSSPVREEFDYGDGGRSVSEDRMTARRRGGVVHTDSKEMVKTEILKLIHIQLAQQWRFIQT